ncbi:MAG TPA: hypothetical protein VMG41_12830 [Gemmatimonadales bacterium]|nr:hypothetical protein [Gemmatimonadales bacterium]
MMMSPEVYQEFRRTAPMHVQVWWAGSSRRARRDGIATVEGRVVRIFRDRDRLLHWGQKIRFNVPVSDPGARSAPAPSGTIYHHGEWLGQARWLEAFLEAWDGHIQLVHSQVLPLRHPTFRPVCGPDVRGVLPAGTLRG